MRFENALVALRKGYKVCRRCSINRLNGVYFSMENGSIDSFAMADNKKGFFSGFSKGSIEASDWRLYEVKHDKD